MTQRMYYSEDAQQRAKQERKIIAVLSTLIGASMGAVLTLLFAPFSGDKARQKLESAMEDSKDKLEGRIEDSLDTVQNMAS